MADHVRKQIRDGAVAALLAASGTATWQTRVFENRNYVLQDADVPCLRVYTNNGASRVSSMGAARVRERVAELVVECCSKKAAGMDDELDQMAKEVEQVIDANQGVGGAKSVEPRVEEVDMDKEADREVGVLRLTFDALYYTRQGSPDVAI